MNAAPLPEWELAQLFDSERFVVVALGSQHGLLYEIVDKASATEVVLTGANAQAFTIQRERWAANVPHEEDVESTLESYLALARLPLFIH